MENKPEFVEVVGKDSNEKDVKVFVKRPSTKEYRDSQVEYNKAFRSALEGGAILKKKLGEHMRSQGLWDDKKDSEEQRLLNKMTDLENSLKKGGIPLLEAKDVALELRRTRSEFRLLIAERTVLDSNTVEGQADNARFNCLVSLCVYKQDKNTLAFSDLQDYEKKADENWASKAAGELASLIYELDPDYDNTLTENKFLKAYNFADDTNQLVNADGHPVFVDREDDNKEYLINADGKFIAYNTDEGYKNQDVEDSYFVNKDGDKVDKEGNIIGGFSPFLDESGEPVPVPEKAEDSTEENEEEVAEEVENTPKKRGRPKKTEEVS
ncbi:hypothetical protein N8257_00925 [Ulvibacter sp.]|mgnify:CR=1 FL=1|nr:hypothetical protein [Ulvibacter sp.]